MSPRILPLVAAALCALLTATEASAQSTTCVNLKADLAALDHQARPSDPYSDAIVRQKAALDQGNADYRAHCTQSLFARPAANCPTMAARIEAMEANLQKLQRAAPQSGNRSEEATRARLQAQIHQSHCDEPQPGVLSTSAKSAPDTISVTPRVADTSPKPQTPPARGGIFSIFLPPASGQNAARPPVSPNPGSTGSGSQTAQPGERLFTLDGPNGPTTYREERNGQIIAVGPARHPDPAVRTDMAARTDPVTPYDPFARQRRTGIIRVPDPDEPHDYSTDRAETDDGQDLSGTFRTLCVRTCDGYYFPVSYAAPHNQFGTDADICHARCPGTETKLYVVKTPGEDGEQSFAPDTGEPYTKLPNALRYRREVVNACTCGRPDLTLMPAAALPGEDRNRDSSSKPADAAAGLPVPDALPPRGEDPETLADLAADFIPQPIVPASVRTAGDDGLRGSTTPKTVRIIGPKFYADR